MGKLTMTRRTFAKMAAATAAAVGVAAPAKLCAGRDQNRHHRRRRGQAHPFHLPRLRQDGMRRVGVCAGWKGHPQRRRRGRLPIHGQSLLQGPGLAAGCISSRSPEVPHEAHEPEGFQRSRLAAHHLGRSHGDHRREVQRAAVQVRQRDVLQHGRHQPHLVHGPLRGVEAVLRKPERDPGQRDLQRPAFLCHEAQRLQRLQLDGDRRPSARVRAVGRRFRAVELR